MVAVDSSTWIAFLGGERGADVDAVDRALELQQVVVPPVVLTEVLSLRELEQRVRDLFLDLPLLVIEAGFWERAAATRATVLAKKLRARLADTLIAQSCIDHGVALVTRDSDFRHFARHAGLVLV
jgi:predicted nucleic acid-binding protein